MLKSFIEKIRKIRKVNSKFLKPFHNHLALFSFFYFYSTKLLKMNYFDIIVGIILILALIIGFKKGLIIELASLVALIIGLFGAIKFSDITAQYLSNYINSDHIGIIAFIGTFILIVVAVHLVAKLVDKLVSAIALGAINRILGALFSLLKYAFILSVLVAVVESFDPNSKVIPMEQKEKSMLYGPISSLAPSLFPYLKFEDVKDKVEEVTTGTEV